MKSKEWLNSIGITVTETDEGFLLEKNGVKLPVYITDLERALLTMPKVYMTLDDFLFNFPKENPASVVNIYYVYNHIFNEVSRLFGINIKELREKYKE